MAVHVRVALRHLQMAQMRAHRRGMEDLERGSAQARARTVLDLSQSL